MDDRESHAKLGYLAAKLETIHDDIRELKEEQIPHGKVRVEVLEKKLDRTIKGLIGAALLAAASLGDSAFNILPMLFGT